MKIKIWSLVIMSLVFGAICFISNDALTIFISFFTSLMLAVCAMGLSVASKTTA